MVAGVKEYMRANNIKEGQGIHFASIEDLVDAVGRCATDESVTGMLLPF